MNIACNMKKASYILLLTCCLGCSVKEDRFPCPSWLQLIVQDCAGFSNDLSISLWDTQSIFSDVIAISDYPEYYEREVPKGIYKLSSYCGISRSIIEGTQVIIPVGQDCDSIYAYSKSLTCSEEFTRDSVKLQKRFARVTLVINMPDDADCPYSFTVKSKICGMDLITFSPIFGEFANKLNIIDNKVTFCLPRQDDSHPEDLHILVEKDEVTFHKIELGQIIKDIGYSWNSKNLNDITLGIDYVKSEISIKVLDWEIGDSYGIVVF